MTTLDFDPTTLPWIDRDDAGAELERRRAAGTLSGDDAGMLEKWRRDGYVHLPGVVEENLVEALLADYEKAWERRPDVKLLVEGKGVQSFPEVAPRAELTHHHYRVMDFQDASKAARRIMLHPKIAHALCLIFGETPVAMQSLFFEYGSEQGLHQDFPYVQSGVLSHLVGCWIACEDVHLKNGPLFYFPGSHQPGKFDWGGGSLTFDGVDESKVNDFTVFLEETAREEGLECVSLDAKKGDVLLWHAALAHGGAPVDDSELTRKSFVVHYSTTTAYPRDRRWPHDEPAIVEDHGARLYMKPQRTLASRLRGLLSRLKP